MPVDYASKTIADLRTMLLNHETKGMTDTSSYRAVLAELGARPAKGLSFDRTLAIIREAAEKGAFVSYATIASESGVKFSSARVAIPKHLLEVCEYSRRRKMPMLSAIVVSKDHLADGGMDAATLAGFCKCARGLGYEFDDDKAFLAEQQRNVFKAAEEGKLA